MTTGIEFCLLGPLTVRCDGVVIPVRSGKERALLAALLLNIGHVVSVEDLAETLWGVEPPSSARVATRSHVMRLRKGLSLTGRAIIATQPGGYLINSDTAELDTTRFEKLLGAARAAARGGSWEAASGHACAAMSLWRGKPLADVQSDVLARREAPRLAEMRLQAVEISIDADLHLGRHSEVIAELHRLVSSHPLRERLHAMRMLALYRDRRQGEALNAYQHARRVLAEELGVDPGPELRGLHQQILSSDPALSGTPATAGGWPAG